MTTINLGILERTVPKFRHFLQTEAQPWQDERRHKDEFFSSYFSEESIRHLDEGTLRELIHILWAFNGWTNKDWLLQEMLKSELPRIQEAFRQLLYTDQPIAERFDYVRSTVRMMGAASISEILAHHDPSTYAIWNRRSREGLIVLGIAPSMLPKSSQISGRQYASFCALARGVLDRVSGGYAEFDNLLMLDFLLYFLSIQPTATAVPPSEDEGLSHDAIIDQVLELGDGLGFEVQREFSVATGCRIDAIWRSRVANLGTIAYAFEVHHRGSRDSAILNLQRVRRDPSIQKVVIVSVAAELERFRGEIASLDERFRTAVRYFDVQDLQRALHHLGQLKDILNLLGLIESES